jgi:hypothetical protein
MSPVGVMLTGRSERRVPNAKIKSYLVILNIELIVVNIHDIFI